MNEADIEKVVDQFGWQALSVSDHVPPFLYTIGLLQSLEHAELIVFGLDPDHSYRMSELISRIKDGESFVTPGTHTLSLDGKPQLVGLRAVHPTQHPMYLGYAMGYCRHIGRGVELEAMQVFWPDQKGKFPYDAGCDLSVYQRQLRLDLSLTPSEIRRFERRWE